MSAINLQGWECRGYPGRRGRYPVPPRSRPVINLLPGQVEVVVYSRRGLPVCRKAGTPIDAARARVTWMGEECVAGKVREAWVFMVPRAER